MGTESPHSAWWFKASLALVALCALTGVLWALAERPRLKSLQELIDSLPKEGRGDDYVSSDTCRACHPREYHSWHRSFHRSMTQVASEASVLGPFEDLHIDSMGWDYHLTRRGEEFWVDMPDPDWAMYRQRQGERVREVKNPPRVRKRVVLTTGSHHYQTYWVPSRFSTVLQSLPLVYLIEEERWIPREHAFLRPPGSDRMVPQWNYQCIKCHSTGPIPGLDLKTGMLDTKVGEFGIACEACHGPGQEHVEANRSPYRRYLHHLTGGADPTIVQPERLDHTLSSQVCGQCHGFFSVKDGHDWAQRGFAYRPGDRLEESRHYFRFDDPPEPDPELEQLLRDTRESLDSVYWPNGSVRASGREFTAMRESACSTRGKISCLSCHSMHDSDPNDQLARGMDGDEACFQCHAEYRDRIREHSHHPVESEGSRCMNCHMPYTVYGLFKAVRSHQIDNPKADPSTARPNACNLCHLDQSLGWTAKYLTEWYEERTPALTQEENLVAGSVLWTLKGDAAHRAVAAWAMGWEPALTASGRGWEAPFLAELLIDPYTAVRLVAERSFRKLPGFESFRYDFIGAEEDLARSREDALQRWKEASQGSLDRKGTQIFVGEDGALWRTGFDLLLAKRDNRPLNFRE